MAAKVHEKVYSPETDLLILDGIRRQHYASRSDGTLYKAF